MAGHGESGIHFGRLIAATARFGDPVSSSDQMFRAWRRLYRGCRRVLRSGNCAEARHI
jgi:hypothetical protein